MPDQYVRALAQRIVAEAGGATKEELWVLQQHLAREARRVDALRPAKRPEQEPRP